jgi:hypothetical protein
MNLCSTAQSPRLGVRSSVTLLLGPERPAAVTRLTFSVPVLQLKTLANAGVYRSSRERLPSQANMPRRGSAGNQAFLANADISYLRSIKSFTLQELREHLREFETLCTRLYSTCAAQLRYLQRMKELNVIDDIYQVTTP